MDAVHAGITGINVSFAVSGVLCLVGLVLTIAFVKDKPDEVPVSERQEKNRTVLESIMRRDVYTIDSHATVLDAMKLLMEKGISAAPVLDNGIVVGVVNRSDLIQYSMRSYLQRTSVL